MTPQAQADYVNALLPRLSYEPLGRGPDVFDCWGLILHVVRDMTGAQPFDPMRHAQTPDAIGSIVRRGVERGGWDLCAPQTGAVAAFGGRHRCVHVGVCIADGVLDISKTGARHRSHAALARAGVRMEFAIWVG